MSDSKKPYVLKKVDEDPATKRVNDLLIHIVDTLDLGDPYVCNAMAIACVKGLKHCGVSAVDIQGFLKAVVEHEFPNVN